MVEPGRGRALPATAAMDSATVVSPIVRLPNLRHVITNELDRQRKGFIDAETLREALHK